MYGTERQILANKLHTDVTKLDIVHLLHENLHKTTVAHTSLFISECFNIRWNTINPL